jgi:hypothetical protein
MHYTPGLEMRVSVDNEIIGIDETQLGELAYDYVQAEIDLLRNSLHPVELSPPPPRNTRASGVQLQPRVDEEERDQARRVSARSRRRSDISMRRHSMTTSEDRTREVEETHEMKDRRWSYERDLESRGGSRHSEKSESV